MGYSYNHGMVTPLKGVAIAACKVTGLDVTPGVAAACTVVQANAGFVLSVIHGATGIYTFTLNAPYPPHILLCHPQISNANGTTDIVIPAYKSASYVPATGVFVINLMNDDDSGAPVLVAGGATDELDVLLMFTRYSTLT